MTSRVKTVKQKKERFSRKELMSYKAKLLRTKEQIIKKIAGIDQETLRNPSKEGSESNSSYGLHMADAASDNYDRDFNLEIASSERKILFEIDEALKRIEEGTYGICEISGKPIPKVRLDAIPYARYTRECQEELESRKKG